MAGTGTVWRILPARRGGTPALAHFWGSEIAIFIFKSGGESMHDQEVSVAQLAGFLNLTVQRVNQLAAEGIIEKTRHGYALLGSSVRRYIDYCVEVATEKIKPAHSTSGERVKAERARKLKLENDERERQLVSMSAAVTTLDVIVGTLKADLAGIPARVTDDVILRRRIEDGIESILRNLSNRFRKASSAMREGRDPYSIFNGDDG